MTYEELVRDHAGEMIEKLVTDVVTKEKAEIHFEDVGDDQWSVVRMHIYEEDKEIALRLHSNDVYDLYFGYYDDKDELLTLRRDGRLLIQRLRASKVRDSAGDITPDDAFAVAKREVAGRVALRAGALENGIAEFGQPRETGITVIGGELGGGGAKEREAGDQLVCVG